MISIGRVSRFLKNRRAARLKSIKLSKESGSCENCNSASRALADCCQPSLWIALSLGYSSGTSPLAQKGKVFAQNAKQRSGIMHRADPSQHG